MTNPFKKIGLVGAPINRFQENVRQAFQLACDKFTSVDAEIAEAQDTLDSYLVENDVLEAYYLGSVTTNNFDVLAYNNIPKGTYDVTVGAQYFIQATDTNAALTPFLNGVAMAQNGTWYIGLLNSSSIAGESLYYLGLADTYRYEFPLEVNTFFVRSVISGSSWVNMPRIVLEKINRPVTNITTEWN